MTKRKPTARAFLTADSGARSGLPCFTCKVPPVAEALEDWARARSAGSPITLNRFFEEHLQRVYSGCPGRTAIRNHVVDCMGLDVSTGRKRGADVQE